MQLLCRNKWWLTVNKSPRNNLHRNFNQNVMILIQQNAFKNVCKMGTILFRPHCVNTLRPRQNGRHFADAIFKCVFFKENVWIPIKISLKFVPKGPINYIPALVQIMVWHRPGDKPLTELMMVSLLMHICVTRPQWVKYEYNDGLER